MMKITLDPTIAERLNKLVSHQGQSLGEVIAQSLDLLEDYQRWEEEQYLADVEAIRQEIEQEGTIPWTMVKADY